MTEPKWKFMMTHWLEIIAGVLLLFMIVMVAIAVTLRYVFNAGIFWSSEAVGYAYVWLIFLGSVIALKKNEHISLYIFLDLLPRKTKIIVRCIGDLLVIFFLLVIIVYGFKLVAETAGVFYSPAMRFPMHFVYLIFPISGFLMLVEMVRLLCRHLRGEV